MTITLIDLPFSYEALEAAVQRDETSTGRQIGVISGLHLLRKGTGGKRIPGFTGKRLQTQQKEDGQKEQKQKRGQIAGLYQVFEQSSHFVCLRNQGQNVK